MTVYDDDFLALVEHYRIKYADWPLLTPEQLRMLRQVFGELRLPRKPLKAKTPCAQRPAAPK